MLEIEISNGIENILKKLKESKVHSRAWKGKWCLWFKEEFEEHPEAEKVLRSILEVELRNMNQGGKKK